MGIVFGLGFVLGFGYWTTNFAEVQRALSARNMSASRRTPLIGAFSEDLPPRRGHGGGLACPKPKPTEELRGLVWGLTRAEEDEENADPRDTSGDGEPRPSTGASDEEEIAAAKAANRFDIRRLIGGLMIFWALSKPTVPESPETRGQGSGRIRRAPAT